MKANISKVALEITKLKSVCRMLQRLRSFCMKEPSCQFSTLSHLTVPTLQPFSSNLSRKLKRLPRFIIHGGDEQDSDFSLEDQNPDSTFNSVS